MVGSSVCTRVGTRRDTRDTRAGRCGAGSGAGRSETACGEACSRPGAFLTGGRR
jgi:hypothetical protein